MTPRKRVRKTKDSSRDQRGDEAQAGHVPADQDREGAAPTTTPKVEPIARVLSRRSLADVMIDLRIAATYRRQYHAAEKRLGNQIGALERALGKPSKASLKKSKGAEPDQGVVETHVQPVRFRADVLLAPAIREIREQLLLIKGTLKDLRTSYEKKIERVAQELPVWDAWVKDVDGCAPLGLGLIIAETRELSLYPNPAKVWKRLGLAVFGGRCQRRVADKEEALRQGYSPHRRSVMWNAGEAFVKQGTYYRDLYLARKLVEAERPGCGRTVGKRTCDPAGHCTLIHIHRRARRYVEKRFVADLWAAWNGRPREEARAA